MKCPVAAVAVLLVLVGCGGSGSMPHTRGQQTSSIAAPFAKPSPSPSVCSSSTDTLVYLAAYNSGQTLIECVGASSYFQIGTLYTGGHGVAVAPSGNYFVSTQQSIQEYSPGARYSSSPIRVISGTDTQLTYILGIALDRDGNIYATNYSLGNDKILEFAAGSSGNVAPIRTITGDATLLAGPHGIAVDKHGHIFVANDIYGRVTEYAVDANGDAPPIAVLSGTGGHLALTSSGRSLLYVPRGSGIQFFAANQLNRANPLGEISGPSTQLDSPQGLSFDSLGRLYVSNFFTLSVDVYPPNPEGNVAPIMIMNVGSVDGIAAAP